MSNPLQQTIEALAKEKGIEPDVVISAIEEAVATASSMAVMTTSGSIPFSLARASMVCCSGLDIKPA